MKKTFIVSRYNNYEWIHTEEAFCKIQLQLKYWMKGYQTWEYPIWFAKLVKKLFNKSIWGNKNCNIELHIPGSDQITYHSAFSNFY